MKVRGSCLCGDVAFEVDGKISLLYKCHCSLCRKYTGTANSTMFATAKNNLSWIRGEELLSTFQAPTGFSGRFCSNCGSPMPKTRWDKIYLIPAGVLDTDPGFGEFVHLHVRSMAPWDEILDRHAQFPGDLPPKQAD